MAGVTDSNTGRQESAREVVVVAGIRTPLGKAGGAFDQLGAVDLGAIAVREVLARSPLGRDDIHRFSF